MKPRERRRQNPKVQKDKASADKIDQCRPFWNSMSLEEKQSLLQVPLSHLKKTVDSFNDGTIKNFVSEAISFIQKYKTWKFWSCCECKAIFVYGDVHMLHVLNEHLGNLQPELLQILPQQVNSNWVEMLLKCAWKPVEVSAAVKMIEDQSKFQYVVPVDGSDIGNHAGSSKEDSVIDGFCFKHTSDSCLDEGKIVEPSSEESKAVDKGSIIENRDHDDITNDELMRFAFNDWPKVYSLAQSWPLSSDSEREDLLERIHDMFKILLKHECLATSQLIKVIKYTTEKLQGLAPKSQLLNHCLARTPLGICFLEASELKVIINQLQDYSRPCRFPRNHENISIVDETHTDTQNSEASERIVLTDSLLPLVLDERLLCNLENSEKSSSSENGATEICILAGDFKGSAFADSDALLSSIFTGPTNAEQCLSWIRLNAEKTIKGMEVLQMLKNEFSNMQTFCERKLVRLNHMKALEGMDFEEAVLQKRKLVERDKITLDAISDVLKEAKPLSDAISRLCVLKSGKDGDGKTQKVLDQTNTRIKETIQRQKDACSEKLRKIDASIMHNFIVRKQLALKLDPLDCLDYQTLILPSIKTIIQSRLVALAEKDATEKSDAATEALLELVLDEKKSKQKQEKSKNKKKKKNNRKPKDSKVAGDIEQTAEQGHFPVASEDFERQEEELRLKMQADAIKLEETLEYQRRIEHEAKQKHLAEENPEAPEEPGGGGSDFSLTSLKDFPPLPCYSFNEFGFTTISRH